MLEELSLALPGTQRAATASQLDLAALVEIYSTLLFRVARSIVGSSAEAEDVVQDTFVRVMEHRQKLPAVRDLRVWLVRITWNLALDRQRRMRPEPLDDLVAATLAASGTPADAALSEAEQLRAVYRVIERLPAAERQALLLSALEELGTAEIAAVMGKSESAVRALLFRARSRLRERLGKNFERGDTA